MYKQLEMNNKPRLTIRLTPNQLQVLEELKDALGVNISMIVRTIILDFITRNETTINKIIDGEIEYENPFLNNYTETEEDYD